MCIPRHKVMDGVVDCNAMLLNDSSDEMTILPFCTKSEFRCSSSNNSQCIPREWVRDGVVDCPSGGDENSISLQCLNSTEFRCKSGGRCIPRYRVMDRFSDCPDGSDEAEALACIWSSEFRCRDNGRCIPRSWRGDSHYNCMDGSDEQPMSTNETCVDGEFKCHNGKRCIPTSLLCDGMDHCGDCSDEVESCIVPWMFRCSTDPTKCIHWSYSCDLYSDCPDNADDQTSVPGFKCKQDKSNRLGQERYCTLPQFALLDDYSHCDDRSDLCYVNGEFRCSRCLDGVTIIAKRQFCDGVLDCPDFSDECLCSKDIPSSNRTRSFCSSVCYGGVEKPCAHCATGQVWCSKDNKCLWPRKVCDRVSDCPLSDIDERLCNKEQRIESVKKDHDFECDAIPSGYRFLAKTWNLETFLNSSAPATAKRYIY